MDTVYWCTIPSLHVAHTLSSNRLRNQHHKIYKVGDIGLFCTCCRSTPVSFIDTSHPPTLPASLSSHIATNPVTKRVIWPRDHQQVCITELVQTSCRLTANKGRERAYVDRYVPTSGVVYILRNRGAVGFVRAICQGHETWEKTQLAGIVTATQSSVYAFEVQMKRRVHNLARQTPTMPQPTKRARPSLACVWPKHTCSKKSVRAVCSLAHFKGEAITPRGRLG